MDELDSAILLHLQADARRGLLGARQRVGRTPSRREASGPSTHRTHDLPVVEISGGRDDNGFAHVIPLLEGDEPPSVDAVE